MEALSGAVDAVEDDWERSIDMDSSAHAQGLQNGQSCTGDSGAGRATSMARNRRESSGSRSSPTACVHKRADRRTRRTPGLRSP